MMKNNRLLVQITAKKSKGAAQLLQKLHAANIRLYKIHHEQDHLIFIVERRHLHAVRKANRNVNLRLTFRYVEKFSVWRRLTTKIGVLFLFIVPFVCSHFIWSIQIADATPEIQQKMETALKRTIVAPSFKRTMLDDTTLRQMLMANDPKLAWVHIERHGSKMTLRPLLAPETTPPKKQTKPSHLIALNGGVITHFELLRGERIVKPNMTVYPGDVLVSGIISQGDKTHIIGAEGAVFADYWLETTFTFPRRLEVTVLQATQWQITREKSKIAWQQHQILQLPYYIEQVPQWETVQITLDEKSLESIMKPILHLKILRTLPQKSTIKSEKLLHVTFDDDTVKGKVLFLINENIATPDPIVQGE